MNNKSANMEITLLFDGIESDNVVEKLLAEIEVTNAGKIKLEINDKINFKENVKVEKLSKSNTFIINDKTQEETISILSKIADRIVEVNKQKIEKAIEQASKGTNNPGIIATIMAYSSALNNSNINSKPNMDINTNKNENLTTDIIENIEKMESNTIF